MSYILDALRKAETERELTRDARAVPRQYDIVIRHGKARRLLYIAVVVACAMVFTWWWARYEVTAEVRASAPGDAETETIELTVAKVADRPNNDTPQRMPSARSPLIPDARPVAFSMLSASATTPSPPLSKADASTQPKAIDIAVSELPSTSSLPETSQTAQRAQESVAEAKGHVVISSPIPRAKERTNEEVAMIAGEVKHDLPLPAVDSPASAPVPEIDTTEVDLPVHDEVTREETLPPLLSTLPYRFQSTLPKIAINAQAYADEAEARFVIINMKKYREGERTEAGIEVEEIGEEDLVLRYQGQLFRLQR